jgi:hypothetical protein
MTPVMAAKGTAKLSGRSGSGCHGREGHAVLRGSVTSVTLTRKGSGTSWRISSAETIRPGSRANSISVGVRGLDSNRRELVV